MHGVTILVRTHARVLLTNVLATVMTVLIAAGAFWLSFTALRELALMSGIPGGDAWLWSLIIEGSMAQVTVALLALAHSCPSRAHESSAREHPNVVAADRLTYVSTETHAGAGYEVAGADSRSRAGVVPGDVRTHGLSHSLPQSWSQVAAVICGRDPARRRDPDEVDTVLARHYDDGWTPTEISREIGRSRSTVSRIISDAAHLEAV